MPDMSALETPRYATSQFFDIDPERPALGYGVWCLVEWLPRGDKRVHRSTAPFLDGTVATGVVSLGCGLDEWAKEVGMRFSDDEAETVRSQVDKQLLNQPWAVVDCKAGQARVVLCVRPRWADDGTPPFDGDEGWVLADDARRRQWLLSDAARQGPGRGNPSIS